jgi:hypothetical protein
MKHNKGQCSIFLESGLPCEDCDLEGHSATCGWHIDWHSCSCEAFDNKPSKWYDCAKCDAGYEDQQCTCEESK